MGVANNAAGRRVTVAANNILFWPMRPTGGAVGGADPAGLVMVAGLRGRLRKNLPAAGRGHRFAAPIALW